MRGRLTAAGLLVTAVGLTVRADDKAAPPDRTDQDKRAALVAYNTITLGVDLWNKKNYEGTFRLYQGGLYGLWAGLGHRPALAASVLKKLEAAGGLPPDEGAFVLREALDAVQAETSGAAPAKAPPPAEKKAADARPLRERLGGEKAVRVMVREFLTAAAADPKVNLVRGRKPDPAAKDLDLFEALVVELVDAADPAETRLAKTLQVEKYTDAEFTEINKHLVTAFLKNGAKPPEAREVLEKLATARAGPAAKK